jgi:hypothetical protein
VPAELEMRGDVAEALDLLVLRRQVLDRVVDDVRSMNVPSTLVVAKSPIVTPMSSVPGFDFSRSTMADETSIPCTRTPR